MKNKLLTQSQLYWLTILSAVVFPLVFSGWRPAIIDFWSLLSVVLLIFLLVALWLDPGFSQLIAGDAFTLGWRKVVLGLVSAVFLYALFYVGNLFLPQLIPGGSGQVARIYALKSGQSQWRLGIFLA
ncbi:MAG TPA: hypothetical protein PKZ60_09330, partial [Candidatus Saccharicenans sp.]|nr:hypothetical protein [Candidatus Saccharicenans sp.]